MQDLIILHDADKSKLHVQYRPQKILRLPEVEQFVLQNKSNLQEVMC